MIASEGNNNPTKKPGSSFSSGEAEYRSCSSPAVEATEEGSQVTEAACNMSANMASKLHQMRSMDSASEQSYESEDLSKSFPEEAGTLGASSASARKTGASPSLRQVFPHISCLPFENNIVFCFVLSVWDNIVGPQTVYVWKRKSLPTQRTFDDLFEDRGNIEVGKDSTELQDNITQGGGEPSVGHKDGESKHKVQTRCGREKTKCNQTENKKYNVADTGSEKFETENPKCSSDKHCISQAVESFCEGLGNDILVKSFEAVKVQERGDSQWGKESTTGHRAEPQTQGNQPHKPHHLKDIEQESGSGWSCGRGRLRVGAVVGYVTVHSVGVGQVDQAAHNITSSLHVVPHQGIIVLAARFTVEEEDGAVPYTLSMVVPLEEYKNFMPLCETVTSWLVTIAATTRLLITKYGLEGGGFIKGRLLELCEVLVALRSASLDQYPLTPAGRPPDDRRLAELILTSHLQTMGSTVVVADSPNAANKVIMWLAQFSDPSTLPASRLCLSYSQWPFHPGLYIQGIVKSSSGEVNLSAQKLIQSSRPLTVVDVGRGTVKQTGPPDVHARRNSTALRQELLSLWHDLPDVSVPSESLLEPVRGASPLAKKFLNDYDRLSSCSNEVRQTFIQAFLRSLKYSALAVITWTKHEWSAQRRRSGLGTLRRALCTVFDLDDQDLRVILAQAELLEPGFYSYVTSMSH